MRHLYEDMNEVELELCSVCGNEFIDHYQDSVCDECISLVGGRELEEREREFNQSRFQKVGDV